MKVTTTTTLLIALHFVASAKTFCVALHFKTKGKNFNIKINRRIYGYTPDIRSSKDNYVWILYSEEDGQKYFTGLMASQSLETQIPLLVLKYIGEKIVAPRFESMLSTMALATFAAQTAVDKALSSEYKTRLLATGPQMIQDSSYYRGHCNTNWWTPGYYYDYKIAFSKDTATQFLTSKVEDSNFSSLNYITEQLEIFGYHHDLKSLATWPDEVMGGRGFERDGYEFIAAPIRADANYHKRTDSCRFELKRVPISHGRKYPKFASVSYFGWWATYCNFFASDLQRKIFGVPLWKTSGCKSDYHKLAVDSDFIAIEKSDIKKYSGTGYFVFLVTESHVTTVYPDSSNQINVVQAGGNTGIFDVTRVWSNFYEDDEKNVVCYVYLGYLKN